MSTPDFNALSEAEQRAVAERLIKIQQSGWKPFWCPDPNCSGDPHQKADGTIDPQWAHNHARVDQRLPPWGKPFRIAVLSGRGCVAPWTLIDLADGTRERIDVLSERGKAVEVMTPDGPRWTEGAPFLKGLAHLWRVRLSTGRVLTVTDAHRFLAPGGWLRLDQVRVGQPLVSAALVDPEVNGPRRNGGLEGWREDVQRCWGTELGSGCGCPTCRRPSDLPLPPTSEDDRGGVPSPAGEDARSHPLSGSGVLESSQGCSLPCRPTDPRSRTRCALCEPSPQVEGCPPLPSETEQSPHEHRGPLRSLGLSSPENEEVGSDRGRGGSSSQPPSRSKPLSWSEDAHLSGGSRNAGWPRSAPDVSLCPEEAPHSRTTGSPLESPDADEMRCREVCTRGAFGAGWKSCQCSHRDDQPLTDESLLTSTDRTLPELTWVMAIEYSHFGPFYDMTVPVAQSYYSEGVVNHNTGKTRTGVEFVTLHARRGMDGAIIGRRGTELVNTHVRALKEIAHPEFVPEYLASKDLIEWPNGAITYLFSAERPENIRSVNLNWFWMDEAAHMDEVETAWMNAQLATRIETPENPIHILITSTPTPTPWMRKIEDDPSFEIRRVSTYANRANLSEDFIKALEKEYEGTRMGRQELHGEVLRDVEGALWNDGMFVHQRAESVEEFEAFLETMDDIVVAVDPAGSKTKRSDATAIVATGRQNSDDGRHRFYVLGATQLKGSPEEWSEATFKMARLVRARRITVERNFGGDMVRTTLTNHAKMNPETATDENDMDFKIEESRAVKGKETRAEPVVARYEQGRVVHLTSPTLYGDLSELEKEQTTWVPKSRGGKMPSPNLVDASVWTITALETAVKYEAQSANRDVLKSLRGVGQRAGQTLSR